MSCAKRSKHLGRCYWYPTFARGFRHFWCVLRWKRKSKRVRENAKFFERHSRLNFPYLEWFQLFSHVLALSVLLQDLREGPLKKVLEVLFAFGLFLNNPSSIVHGIKFSSYLKVFLPPLLNARDCFRHFFLFFISDLSLSHTHNTHTTHTYLLTHKPSLSDDL